MNEPAHDKFAALVRMANQIAVAFRVQPHAEAVASTAEHIQLYWSRKMRADIISYVDAGGQGLEAMTIEAIKSLRA